MSVFATINGKRAEFLTLNELAVKCKRSKYALFKLIERGKMPDANYRGATKFVMRGMAVGKEIPGQRLYSKEFLVPILVEIISKISQGKAITAAQHNELCEAFQAEQKYFQPVK